MSNTKDAVIGLLHSSLKDRDDRVDILRNIIKDNDATILELRKTLEGRDTRVLELLTTVVELRKTLEERDTRYETNLKTALAVKDTINADLCKAIEEQRDALRDMSKVIKERDVTIRSLHLSLGEAYERDTDNYCNPE